MGIFCVLLAVLITAGILITGQYNDTTMNIMIWHTNMGFELSFLVLSLIIFSLGILTGVLLMLNSFFEKQNNYSKLRKQYDKTSVGADDAEEKIKLLENKIKTLEAALKKQIEG